ncbi:serine incorporator/TMS membrane protein [Catenaria anguillulae PL171]|uniref:Serine incorporator/TMS membrane protein n=1 Tax=Catenaria anguillulae PL171 TaxID=765915 RepID=A0A1Y2I378_9FUNG|nr:serine incorporator/TMS membrane protein [Catenaria anguillulae PL171]
MGFILVGIFAVSAKYAPAPLVQWAKSVHPITGSTNCTTRECLAIMFVFRIILANVMYHTLHMVLLVKVTSTSDPRSHVQNAGWWIKGLLLLGIIVAMFFVPAQQLEPFPVVSFVFTTLFLLMQTFLLVDFAHSWAERCLIRYEETQGVFWKLALITVTVFCYGFTIAGITLLYVAITPTSATVAILRGPSCWISSFSISTFLILNLLQTFLSVHPTIRKHNSKSGLLQSAIIAVYTTYLLVSALGTDPFQCGGSVVTSIGGGTAPMPDTSAGGGGDPTLVRLATIGGAILSLLALSYSAFGTASTQFFLALAPSNPNLSSGSSSSSSRSTDDDETQQVNYSYSFFHFTFAIASFYLGVLVTDWITYASDEVLALPVALRSLAPVWVKLGSGWMVIMLYLWTLVAPIVLPNRDFS